MEIWKKFEVYIDKIKKGILTINPKAIKKALKNTVIGVITATTLTGCSFSTQPPKTPLVVSEPFEFDDLDKEIYYKQYFVDSVLEELNNSIEKYNNTVSVSLKNKIMDKYKIIRNLEDTIDSNNDYAAFLTEEEIESKKINMMLMLNECITIIENNLSYRFGVDFIAPSKSKS